MQNSVDVTRVKSILSEKMETSYDVYTECLKLPRIKVVNVDTELEKADLVDDIYNRNFLECDGGFNVLSDHKNSFNKRVLILELLTEAHWPHTKSAEYLIL